MAAIAQERARLLAGQPPLGDDGSICVSAYRDLGTCRSNGMDIGAIPWTAVIMWADFHGLDRDATAILWGVIRYVENENAEREASKRRLKEMRGDS